MRNLVAGLGVSLACGAVLALADSAAAQNACINGFGPADPARVLAQGTRMRNTLAPRVGASNTQNNFPVVGTAAGFQQSAGKVVSTQVTRTPGPSLPTQQLTGNGQGGPAFAPQGPAGNPYSAGFVNPYNTPFGNPYNTPFGNPYAYNPYAGYPPVNVYSNPYQNALVNPYYVNPFNNMAFNNPFYSNALLANPLYNNPIGPGAMPPFAPVGFGNQGIGNPFPPPLGN